MDQENEVNSDIVNKDNTSNNINNIPQSNKDINNIVNEKENKDFEADKNEIQNSNHKEGKNNELPLNENEGEAMKEENSLDIKPKGYVRVFRKYIKKKGQIMNNIIDNRFKLWKKITLKGLTIKKTIYIRVSVSKEKDRKNKSYSEAKINIGKKKINNINIIDPNKLLESNKTSEIKPSKYKRIFDNKNKDIKNKDYNKPQNQKLNLNNTIGSNSSTHRYNRYFKNNNQSNNNNNKNSIDDKAVKQSKNWKNPIIEISSEKPKNDQFKNIRNVYKNNINLKNKFNKTEISKNNSKQNTEINSSKLKYINKLNNTYNKNNNKNENNNISKNNNLKYAANNYNNNTITLSSKKAQNVFNSKEKQFISPYNTKKYIPQKKLYSEKKAKEYNSYFLKTYQNKNNVFKPMIKNIQLNLDNNFDDYQYLNFTSRRAKLHIDNNSSMDKKTLKKGITSVIQHFSGKIEEYLNYDKSTSKSKKLI